MEEAFRAYLEVMAFLQMTEAHCNRQTLAGVAYFLNQAVLVDHRIAVVDAASAAEEGADGDVAAFEEEEVDYAAAVAFEEAEVRGAELVPE